MTNRIAPASFAIALAALLAACGIGSATPTPTPVVYSGLITASEFVTGPNRFPFGLVSRDGEFLEGAEVAVRFHHIDDGQIDGEDSVFLTESPTVWRVVEGTTPHRHPDGELHLHLDFQGVYVVDRIDFPAPGVWGAEFVVADETQTKDAIFEVKDAGSAPGIGQRPPATENLTIHDVASFAEISTRSVEGDELHNVSVAQALEVGAPFVVFFASPQFCTSALCGPVTDTLDKARGELDGAVEFIHIEPWDLDAARNEGRLVPRPVMTEWGLPTEPWTFVVGADGRIAARYEGLVTVDEVLSALRPLL